MRMVCRVPSIEIERRTVPRVRRWRSEGVKLYTAAHHEASSILPDISGLASMWPRNEVKNCSPKRTTAT
jgi:hypothetical protein